jgi:hypothetical protein
MENKEQPKQEFPQIGTKEWNDLASQYFGGKSKQEILEEAAKEYLFEVYQKQFVVKTNDIQFGVLKGFIEGVNWQAKKMYSEE